MSIPLSGYADLLKALNYNDPEVFSAVAECLNFEKSDQFDEHSQKQEQNQSEYFEQKKVETVRSADTLQAIPFWQVTNYEKVDDSSRQASENGNVETKLTLQTKPGTLPFKSPLITAAQLSRKLRQHAAQSKTSRTIDVDQVVHKISMGERLQHVPKLTRRRWGSVLQIICDHSVRLTPYWTDQLDLITYLQKWFPKSGVEYAFVNDGCYQPAIETINGDLLPYKLPPAGSLVLVLTDLGCLDKSASQTGKFWQALGDKISSSGSQPVALVPGGNSQIWKSAEQAWRIVPMEDAAQSQLSMQSLDKTAEQILTLCAFATRIQPGYLRAIRKLIGADAAVEALVWQHAELTSPNMYDAPVDINAFRLRQKQWPVLSNQKQGKWGKKALLIQSEWRNGYSEELWAAEITSMPKAVQCLDVINKDLGRAKSLIRQIDQVTDGDQSMQGLSDWVNWFLPISRNDPDLNAVITHLHEKFGKHVTDSLPSGYQPQFIKSPPNKEIVQLDIFHRGALIEFAQHAVQNVSETQGRSLINQIRTRNGQIKIGSDHLPLDRNRFWKSGQTPDWANDWGEDEFGLWVEFAVEDNRLNNVTQRMRWIESGSFIMGSQEDEPGRRDDEGLQHEVTLKKGYWMFDTPVTQALYEAVTGGDNPSRFKSTQRPIEQVSWKDAQQFIQQLNKKIPELSLSLPTETQWEYACRAGTTEATYAGPIAILGVNNAPVLDDIAWYGGNSGVDFDLKEGEDSSGWEEKQYNHQQAGTRRVAQKKANPWGLYDMLGNVWEWCEDGQREYKIESEIDPIGSQEVGVARVLRGGSWGHYARHVRCAYRNADDPESASNNAGFRCARVHEPEKGNVAEPVEMLQVCVAEQRSAASQPSGARLVDCTDLSESKTIDWPQLNQFVILSDSEKICLRQFGKPQWAYAIGRDQYGLWASFKLEQDKAASIVQKMRWISPGQFLMGSLEDEAGRLTEKELAQYNLKAEGPQHSVVISHGFWLFDTPVTQALYQAVTGDNPSRFKSAQRPVEQVSWKDAQQFIQQLNKKIPELSLSLPTEAQWEYACRAGTTEATYAGPIAILGVNNAPVLDYIAWYGGNSGVDFDLKEGEDSSGWAEKQYNHQQAGTRKVAQKKANPWGLYDMLGNAWEWCEDGLRDYEIGPEVDPLGSQEAGVARVLRGGSWDGHARLVRCASRNAIVPEYANGDTGFRCARVHVPGIGSERHGHLSDRVAEQRTVDAHVRGD